MYANKPSVWGRPSRGCASLLHLLLGSILNGEHDAKHDNDDEEHAAGGKGIEAKPTVLRRLRQALLTIPANGYPLPTTNQTFVDPRQIAECGRTFTATSTNLIDRPWDFTVVPN